MKRGTIILAVVLVATSVGMAWQQKMMAARAGIRALSSRLVDLDRQATNALESLDAAREELDLQTQARRRAAADLAKAQRELAKIDPESQWAEPPPGGPHWDSESPYVWMSKESLQLLPIRGAFTTRGRLDEGILPILAADPALLRALDDKLENLADYHHAWEIQHATKVDQPTTYHDGVACPSRVAEIGAMPEQESYYRRMEASMKESLGPQRARLILEYWRGDFGDPINGINLTWPARLTLSKNSKGAYALQYQYGFEYGNFEGFSGDRAAVCSHIPPYLLPMFEDFFDATDGAAGTAIGP